MKRNKILIFVLVALIVLWIDLPSYAATGDEPGWWEAILRSFWDWLVGAMQSLGNTVMDYMLNALPEGWADNLSGITPFLEVANAWLPLSYGFQLLVSYYAFILIFVVVKQIRALIPTIS